MDLRREEDAAEAPVRMAMTLVDMGHREEAGELLSAVPERFGEDAPWTAMARVRALELQHRSMRQAREPDWESHRKLAVDLRKRYEEAAGDGAPGSSRMVMAAALATLEVGRTQREMNEPEQALATFDSLIRRYPEQQEACARALMGTAEIFRSFDQPDAERHTYVRLLRGWGQAEPWATRAARDVVQSVLAEAGETVEERGAALRALIERHDRVPLLPALAQNRLGDLQYRAGDYRAAAMAYRRAIEDYPDSPRQVAAAHLALGELQLEREQYPAALVTFRRLREHIDRTGGWAFERGARRGYVRAALRKGRAELNQGDPPLARSTFQDLIDFDGTLPVAHRGLVDCLAQMGRVEEAIRRYRPMVEEEPRNAVAHFALARAYSYYGPQEWRADSSLSRRRVAIDREALKLVGRAIMLDFDAAYYHQLRGFLFNRIALATGAQEARLQALDSYLSALGLSDPELDPQNHANLLFNAGEGYMLVEQPENPYDYYRRAVQAGFGFEGQRGEAALQKISRAAMDAGNYEFAVDLLNQVLERVGGPLPEVTSQRVEVLVRRGRILDLLALAHYLSEDYERAARNYRRSIRTIRRLLALDPAARSAYMRNLLRAQRNQAINLYHAVGEGRLPLKRLRRSWELLQESLAGLEEHGTIATGETPGPGLFTVDIRVAIGEGGAAGEFDLPTEKRLLYTYLARISALAANYREAERFLLDKLDHYPEFDPEDRPDLASEQGILWSQVGEYRLRRGELPGAAQAFETALGRELRAGNLVGATSACFSLGRLLVRLSRRPPGGRGLGEEQFSSLLRRVVSYHRELLAAAQEEPGAAPAPALARLERNLTV
ncbi:MAG: tetratricopeptide repeat protein, partial [Thiohalospira sp.]